MESNKILKASYLDILFDGRNKEYGAYDLRKTYSRRITIALITTVTIIALLFLGSVIANNISSDKDTKQMNVKDLSLEAIKPNEPPPPPPPPPPKLPPPPPIATIAFTPPKVVKDQEVIKPPPEVKDLDSAKVDTKTVEGTKDVGVVAPPTEDKGTQVVAAPVAKDEDADKVFTKVEIDAQFPGGNAAWTKYVTKAIQADIDELQQDQSNSGTCVVRFIVDKTGKVSDVEATTMKGSKLAEIAVNAIRKGPNWTPAVQNGRQVNAYRLQPVTFTFQDQ